MALFRTVAPLVEPVTLAEAKAHLRLDHDHEDTLVAGLITVAREHLEQTTGLALIDQSWRMTLDDWPRGGVVPIGIGPVRAIIAVTVFAADGAGAVIDPASLQLDGNGRPARLCLPQPAAPLRAMNGIEIDFGAGFGAAGPDVPDTLRRAILVLVAHMFEVRAGFGVEDQPVSLPASYERLVAPWTRRRL